MLPCDALLSWQERLALSMMMMQACSSCMRPYVLVISSSLTMFAAAECSDSLSPLSARSCKVQQAHHQYIKPSWIVVRASKQLTSATDSV